MPGPRPEPRVGVLEDSQEGGEFRHLLLGRAVQDGAALAVRLGTEQGSSWLPVCYVPLQGPGRRGLQASWRLTVETTHGPVEVAIALPLTALLRWAVRARPVRAEEAGRVREAADEIEAAAAALREALEAPSSGLGDLGRRLLAIEPGNRLEVTQLRDLVGRMGQPRADAELDWLDEFADELEQEVARYKRYAAGGVLSNEAHQAVQREGARLLA